jgi:hypothetical protein
MPDIVTAALKIRHGQQDEAREAAGEIWQQTKDVPSLIFTGRHGTPIDPRTLNRQFVARPRACVRSLFMMPGTRVQRCSSTSMCIRA